MADSRSLVRRRLLERIDFELDDFQRRAFDAIDRDESVLVAAPTSSGKTLVAEYAIDLALASGAKAFYTTPIKALSNQKYGDFLRRLGADQVGLLTGDNAINGDAPVVVMTTEVLRNMIYAGSPALDNLRYVILDEVHYLQDAYRGPVWEEVIIHASPSVRLVCLSATVSNAGELSEWISTVRGDTEAVVEDRRPVELHNLYMVGDKDSPELHLLPTLVDGRPNAEASRLDAESLRAPRQPGRVRQRRRYYTPGRVDVVEHLAGADLLPAIYFIFSRAACDDAARACVGAGLRLAGPDERQRIRDIVEDHTASLSDADLDVLGYDEWLNTLELGIAAHHAGMVPAFKEAVEACFAEGLIRVVFATETLALGINMPARTVVIEKLSKFTGERHEFLTPGEYTQLTGRAGRRGIDRMGYAVVLWSPFVPFDQVAALAASRSFRLTSAFRPTYNMAANLVYRYSAEQAHHLLNLSFAQYQADRSVVSIESRLEKRRRLLDEAEAAGSCSRGDAAEYRNLVQAAADARRHTSPKGEIAFALSQVRPGSVLHVDTPRLHGRVAVLTYAQRRNDAKLRVITTKGKVQSLGIDDFHEVPQVLGQIELPVPFAPNNHNFQHRVARELQRARVKRRRRIESERDNEAALAEAAVRRHPVHDCPDRDAHVQAQARIERLRREIDDLKGSVRGRTESLARRFDRVLRVLEAWGHLDGWQRHRQGFPAPGAVPRVRPADRRVPRRGRVRRARPAGPGRSRLGLHLRAPKSRTGAPARLPVAAGAIPLRQDRRAHHRAQRRRAGRRPPPDPGARSRLHGHRRRVGRRRRARPGDRRRRDLRRRLRPQHQTGRRSAAAARRRVPRHPDRSGGRPGGRRPVPRSGRGRRGGGRGGRRRPRAGRGGPGRGRAHLGRTPPGRRAVTVEKGRTWGSHGPAPADAILVRSDAEARSVVLEARRSRNDTLPVLGLLAGDLCRTLGGRGDETRLRSDDALHVPVDLGLARLDGRETVFVAHLVARRSWWAGRAFLAMNAQYLGRWDVAPRSHPNDGRLDTLDLNLSLGDRWKARSRVRSGTHVPHPGITERRVRTLTVRFDKAVPVAADGVGVGTARELTVRVEPDALRVVV